MTKAETDYTSGLKEERNLTSDRLVDSNFFVVTKFLAKVKNKTFKRKGPIEKKSFSKGQF